MRFVDPKAFLPIAGLFLATTAAVLFGQSDGQNPAGAIAAPTAAAATPRPAPTPEPTLNAIAGPDRIAIDGGQTYLNGWAGYGNGPAPRQGNRRGAAPPPARPPVTVQWTKESGPGEVKFGDAAAAVTNASFTARGEYVLVLSADNGEAKAISKLKVKIAAPPPAEALEPVDITRFQIDNPLWNNRAKALMVNWIPHVIQKINEPELPEGGINNIIDAANKLAGKEAHAHRGYPFSNAWVFNTIEAICVALQIDPQSDAEIAAAQKTMRETLDAWIPLILAAQESDGYFQTSFTLRGISPAERWSPRRRADHEGYVAGYFIEAGIAHYQMTGGKDRRLYDAALRLADCWQANLGPAPKKAWFDGHQAVELALVRLGRFQNQIAGGGKGDKYIELAKFLLDNRKNGSEYDQSHLPVIAQYTAAGHAVRAAYSYTGMADVALETGNVDYQSAVTSLWDSIVNRKYYVTGGIGSGETSEGFGPDFSLRSGAYCESCSSAGEIFFQHRMHLIYGEARYADLYEETLYNALMGSVDMAADNFYYTNPLDSRGNRAPWHQCPCCVGNIPRTLLSLPTWTYSKDTRGIYVNLFVGSTMTIANMGGMDVEMIQKTNYPWSGDVAITVNPAQTKTFSVRVRVPDRSVSELYTATPEADGIASLAVNGEKTEQKIVNGYAEITREWKKGDKIELRLPMTPQIVRGDERIAATRGKVALKYGPVVYSVERVDQNIERAIDANAPLTAVWRDDLLGGVMTLKGKWADGTDLVAIPTYARNNRGTGDAPAPTPAATPAQGQANPQRRALLGAKVWINTL